jgi:S1-C subfamily serine protease
MKKYRNEDFEFTARDIGFDDKSEEQWSADQKGAVVDDVKSGGWAELGTLYTGDLILEVDNEAIQTVDQLRPAMEKISKAKKRFVIMKVLRGIHTKFLELEPKWTP